MLGDIILGYKTGARRLAAAGVILAAGVSLSACGGAAEAAGTATASIPPSAAPEVGGYEGWWNATPASGITAGLPQEAVAVNTRTNKVVDAFSRRINDAGRATLITDVPYTVVPDPSWPADSVVIIDTATNKVIEDFRVDLNGNPLR
jgi:YVTN family beta-propeller protein